MSRLRQEAEKDPTRWPRILSTTENKAYSPKIEWLLREPDGRLRAEFNYAQIFRSETVEDLLDGIEASLMIGRRAFYADNLRPLGVFGGIVQFLGRGPLEGDIIELRILRDLGENGGWYVAELSLMVVSRESIEADTVAA